MARRNARGAQGGPSYLTQSTSAGPVRTDEGAWSQFLREQIYAPEYRSGNWNILTGFALFTASIVGVRLFGEALAPA
jgi:hypothetical protein